MLKEDFIDFRHGNASKNKFNDYCDKNGLEEHKVGIDEVDTSNEVLPTLDFLQVTTHYDQKHSNIASIFSFD